MRCEWCGHEYDDELGRWGCPNCLGEGLEDDMDDMFPDAAVPLDEQIRGVQREIELRERVYERRVSSGRMSQEFADQQIRLMKAVRKTLTDLQEKQAN